MAEGNPDKPSLIVWNKVRYSVRIRHEGSALPVRRGISWVLALCALSALRDARADPQPLWELGLGAGVLGFADYRGADSAHVYPLPVPYIVYRGKFLKADEDGVRQLLFNQPYAELNLSLNATTPVFRRASGARAGMPDLKATIEAGPALALHLWHTADRRVKLDLRLPLRAALTVESSPQAIGWLFTPQLAVDIKDVWGKTGWKLGLLAGPLYADRRYDDYFYSVEPRFSTPDRPAYHARDGYAGSEALVSLSKRFPGFWVGAYARYDSLSGATFTPSPLVRRHGYGSAGIAIAWILRRSSRQVDADD